MKKIVLTMVVAACLGCGGAPAKKPDPTPAGKPNAALAATTTPEAAKGHDQGGPPTPGAPAPGAPAEAPK